MGSLSAKNSPRTAAVTAVIQCAHCREGELTAAETEDMRRLMEAVPGLKQRIAGKSLPMEKFAIR